jgi:hypothetical protein
MYIKEFNNPLQNVNRGKMPLPPIVLIIDCDPMRFLTELLMTITQWSN